MRRVISDHYFDRSLNACKLALHPAIAYLTNLIFDCFWRAKDGRWGHVAMGFDVLGLPDFDGDRHAGAAFCPAANS